MTRVAQHGIKGITDNVIAGNKNALQHVSEAKSAESALLTHGTELAAVKATVFANNPGADVGILHEDLKSLRWILLFTRSRSHTP